VAHLQAPKQKLITRGKTSHPYILVKKTSVLLDNVETILDLHGSILFQKIQIFNKLLEAIRYLFIFQLNHSFNSKIKLEKLNE
jgi:hypothetical protein